MRWQVRPGGGVIQVSLTDGRRLWIGADYIRRVEQDETHTNVELDTGEVLKIKEPAERFAMRINRPIIVNKIVP